MIPRKSHEKILLVGDTPSIIDVLRTTLESEGYSVFIAHSGKDAISEAKLITPDLILLDFLTPPIDGVTVCRQFKSDETLNEIPIIFITSLTATKLKVQAFETGCVDYITKPLETDEVLGRIRTHLSIQYLRKQLKIQNDQLDKEIANRIAAEKKIKALTDTFELRVQLDEIEVRKKVENELRDSEELHRVIFQNIFDPVLITDERGKFIYIGSNVVPSLGYSVDEIKYMESIYELIGHDFFNFEKLNREGAIYNIETFIKDRTGEERAFLLNVKRVSIKEGKILFTLHDITNYKQAGETSRTSEEEFKQMFRYSASGMVLVAPDFRFIKANIAFCRMLGYNENELTEKTFQDVTHSEDRAVGYELSQRVLSGEIEMFNLEKRYLHKNGAIVWGLVSSSLIRDARNNPLHFVSQIQDITERKRIEEELSKHQHMLSHILNSIPQSIFWKDRNSVYLGCNEVFAKEAGLETPEQIVGKTDFELPWLEAETEAYRADDREVIESNRPKPHIIETVQRADGTRLWVDTSKIPLNNEKGEVYGILGVYEDITERKRVDEEIRRLTHAIEQSPVSVIITNTVGEIEYVNPKFTEMTGYTIDEVRGRNPRILKSGETKSEQYTHLWESITSGKQWRGEFHNRKKNGELFWESASISPVRNEKGVITHFIAIKEDMTEQKRIATALKESEEQYRTLVATVPDIIIKTDLEGNVNFINDAFLQSQAYPPVEQLIGKNLLTFISPEQRKRAIENLRLRVERQLGPMQYQIQFETGIQIDCEVNGNVLRDTNGKPYGMVYVFRDITARKQFEKELEDYRFHLEELIKLRTIELEDVNARLQEEIVKQKEAEEKVKAALIKEKEFSELKSKFISIASHEFRTPLSIIFSSTELLHRYGRKWNEDQYVEQIDRVKFNVHFLTEIMDDVLTISRVDTGKIKFAPKETNVEQMCLGIIEDINLLVTNKHNLEFKYNLEEKFFKVDERLLKHVLLNLLSNAVKYSIDGGKIEFTIDMKPGELIFEIIDEGIGIPEKDQSYLFEPFHRGENVGEIQGTGLGMSIIKRSVDVHKGSITFESKVNVGTKFTVKIPV